MNSSTSGPCRLFGIPVSVRFALLAAAFSVTAACSGSCGACGGCDGFQQKDFPKNQYDKTVEQSGQIRLTKTGLDFIEQNMPALIRSFRPQGLNFCIPENSDPRICFEDTCNNGQTGCQLNLSLDNAELNPMPPDTLNANLRIGGLNQEIPVEQSLASCTLDLHKDGAGDSVPAEIGVDLPLKLAVDSNSELNNVTVRLGEISTDLNDLELDLEGGFFCSIGSLFVDTKDLLRDRLTSIVREQVTQNFCKTCGSQMAQCPNNSSCGSQDGVDVCKWSSNDECVSSPLGLEGQLQLDNVIGDLMEPDEARVDSIFRAADLAEVDTGASIGLRTGTQQTGTHPCVPADPETRPSFDPVPKSSKILTDTQPNNGDPFMVGVGIHERTVEHLLWSSWASGGTCLRVGSDFNDRLVTDALKLFIPSIENLTESSRPLFLRVSPQTAPQVELGANNIQETEDGFQLQEPLMTVNWSDMDLHFYAFVQDRYTRLYTTRLDLQIPIGLQPNGMGQIVPVVGDLENAFENIRVRNNRLLEESKEDLRSVVPMLLSQALPQLTGSLSDPIDLPSVAGLDLVLESDDITSVDDDKFIALYTDLQTSNNPQSLRTNLAPRIRDVQVYTPPVDEGNVPEPMVTVDLQRAEPNNATEGASHQLEYSYRVDNGFWSLPERNSTLEIQHPSLSLQGKHRIQIRARTAGVPGTASRPVERTVRVDYQAPDLELVRDGRTVTFEGNDVVDDPEQLEYRYRAVAGDGEVVRNWTNWSPAAELDLVRLGAEGPVDLEVEVRDRSGHVTRKSGTFPTSPTILGADQFDDGSGAEGTGGVACSSTDPRQPPAGWMLLLALSGLGLLVRRRRLWTGACIGLVAALGFLSGGCSDDISGAGAQSCDPACSSGEICENGECVPSECSSDSDCSCDNGQPGVCLDGACSCEEFCPDGCGEDSFCCFSENSCQPLPDPCSETDCDPGFEARAGSSGTPDPKTCEISGADCECVELEPLRNGWFGKQTSIDARDGTTAVSTYNRTYGDLMVGTLDGELNATWNYVDGVPADGEVTGAPSGPRGGVSDPGEDVGTHSAVAVDGSGRIHVLYRDRDADTLKYARGSRSDGNLEFSRTVLREREGAGLYASATVRDGVLHAVYGVDGVEQSTANGNTVDGSELRYVNFPVDTELERLAPEPDTIAQGRTRNPCGACTSDRECFVDSNSCSAPTSNCGDDGCGDGQECLDGSCEAIYEAPDPVAHRMMTGLYTEIIPRSEDFVVLYYDHVQRRVEWVTGTSGDWSEPETAAIPSGPYGSAAVDSNGELHVAYMDPKTKSLLYRTPGGDSTEQIVDGVRSSGDEHLMAAVGHDVDLWVDSGGGVHVTYHDATGRRLFRADRQGESNWSAQMISGPGEQGSFNGSRGFYAANPQPGAGVVAEMVIDQQVDPVEARVEFQALE